MILRVNNLQAMGVEVRIFENYRTGRHAEVTESLQNVGIEINFTDVEPLRDVVDSIHSALRTPAYADVILKETFDRLHTFQLLEAIETADKD